MLEALSVACLTLAVAVSPDADIEKIVKARPLSPAQKLLANSTLQEMQEAIAAAC